MVLATAFALGTATAAEASDSATPLTFTGTPGYMRVYGPTEPPSGFQRLCGREPAACARVSADSERADLDPEQWLDLVSVNQIANETVSPVSDQELYGTSEYWALPRKSGDCEDYALLKQRMLIERGWSQGALLLTVVRDETGQGHAVLTARTSGGDFILDNRYPVVRLFSATPYSYVKRQSYADPKNWVSLEPVDRPDPRQSASAGRQD